MRVEFFSLKQMVALRAVTTMLSILLQTNKTLFSFEDYQKKASSCFLSEIHSIMWASVLFLFCPLFSILLPHKSTHKSPLTIRELWPSFQHYFYSHIGNLLKLGPIKIGHSILIKLGPKTAIPLRLCNYPLTFSKRNN